MTAQTPKHWLDALENDVEFQKAKRDADRAFMEYRDIRDYASRELKRVFYVDRETGFYTDFKPVYMFGNGYTDAELGAYCYEAKVDYERLQSTMNAETQRVFKTA